MASSTVYKVFQNGKMIAACVYPQHAAMLMVDRQCVIKYDHGAVVWNEDKEPFGGQENPAQAGRIIAARALAIRAKAYDRQNGTGAAKRVYDEQHGDGAFDGSMAILPRGV